MLVSDADPTRRAPVDVALNEVVEDELLVAHADIGAIADAGRRIGPFDYGIRIDLREPLICMHGQLPRRDRRRRSPLGSFSERPDLPRGECLARVRGLKRVPRGAAAVVPCSVAVTLME
jgi:hypothetical protein